MNNDKNREKLIALLKKLESNQIDQDTFNREYDNFINSEEYKENIRKANKISFKALLNPWCIVLIVALILGLVLFYASPYIGREYITAKDLGNIQEPLQEETNGRTILTVDDTRVELEYLYKYSIKGKVVATYHYLPTKIANKLSPVDVGIAWGYILNEPEFNKIKWIEDGNRFLHHNNKKVKEWENAIGGIEGLYSNNHLIPSTNKIRTQIKKIKVNDYVQIEGYLVAAQWKTDRGKYNWNSSTTRIDTGNGACEIILVTDIKWLKEG